MLQVPYQALSQHLAQVFSQLPNQPFTRNQNHSYSLLELISIILVYLDTFLSLSFEREGGCCTRYTVLNHVCTFYVYSSTSK